jgi:peptidoglycan hydrolase-like protein with peptidoglycan-binding domain
MRFMTHRRPIVATLTALTLLTVACDDGGDTVTSDDDATEADDPVVAAEEQVAAAEDAVSEAEESLIDAHGQFCGVSEEYVDLLDRYGRVFTDADATVGDITTIGDDLIAPREDVESAAGDVTASKDELAAAQQALVDAQTALAAAVATASSVPLDSTSPETTTTTTLVAPATIERVQQAEDDFANVSEDITDETPLVEAAADFNSAALALEVVWLVLLNDAECLTDEQQASAIEQVTAYTTALQTDLTTAGFDPGPIDGVYGPSTVAAVEELQTESGLRVTGFVDESTSRALQEKLAAADQAQASQTSMVQTILSLLGFWDGPIDGVWTEELTQALMEFQTVLGVEPTGVVDAATIAAFQQSGAANEGTGSSETVPATPSTDAPTVPPTTAPTSTAPAEEASILIADSDDGPIVTSGDGMAAYLFITDAQGAPTCTDSCAATWPPLVPGDTGEVTGGEGVDPSLLGTIEHPDAGTQVVYNGWPLYTFAGDADPGDTNGQAQNGVWYLVDPNGDPVGDE